MCSVHQYPQSSVSWDTGSGFLTTVRVAVKYLFIVVELFPSMICMDFCSTGCEEASRPSGCSVEWQKEVVSPFSVAKGAQSV